MRKTDFSKLWFSRFKKFPTRSVFGELQLIQISLSFETSFWSETVSGFSIMLNKNINFNKTKQNQKWKTLHTVLERQTLRFSSYKNHKLKVKLWWVEALERKKRGFFVPFLLSEGNFFKNCVLYQGIVYWVHFKNMHTFADHKNFLACF